jgi:hypothetical protein
LTVVLPIGELPLIESMAEVRINRRRELEPRYQPATGTVHRKRSVS